MSRSTIEAVRAIRPRLPDPMTAPGLRWGVLGSGWIADRFVAALREHTRQTVVAVASREPNRRLSFADRHDLPRTYGDAAALAADPGVEIVYVATPHPAHLEGALAAIDAGKPALVEKPLGLDADQATRIADRARAAGVYCAEALWTFFLPRFDVVRQVLESGAIGELRTVLAEYGEWLPDGHRAMDPALAGGSLLDLGSYPVALAALLLGEPVQVLATGETNRFGVNAQTGALVRDRAGALAVLYTGLGASTPTAATIAGSRGAIELPGPFYQPGDVVVRTWADGEILRYTEPAVGHQALCWEAAAVARDLAAGRTQSAERPLAHSIAAHRLMDTVRQRIGVVFTGT